MIRKPQHIADLETVGMPFDRYRYLVDQLAMEGISAGYSYRRARWYFWQWAKSGPRQSYLWCGVESFVDYLRSHDSIRAALSAIDLAASESATV